ncbi:GGDEF domain-containing protein [Mycolicibacterium fluoranthenivorans]|uniref:Diguanylate cyclase (GGDEF)-like protein n=1 Tax=Mycolicibacterium fluoranthenivorans TaxID=258505 RepID=A0A7X5ZD72_9MYCO|nr:GGDEF domain-containing protein [Mycolicibacterium fluoranthenivorans]MCV7358066.1 GGDEF domain-containing protein [Mycolicibacterium fluoranthenivorans]NIH95816.1 diguanylate cyclase (GGDEF)-like protein [Mycolicibacterium fluoranthenivorans]
MRAYIAALRSWWRQPDHYDWLSSYLAAQGLRGPTRVMMVLVIVLLGTGSQLMHWSPTGPAAGLPRTLSTGVTVITASLAAPWALHWPTRRESRLFAMVAAVCIAAAALLDRDPAAGLLGCTVFAAIAGYVAFFHTSPVLVSVIALAFATSAINAGRLAAAGDPAGALARLLVVTVGVLAVPCSLQVLVHLLGSDAAESDLDALTGVYNRRGFRRVGYDLFTRAREAGVTTGMVLVDLDGFKRINDTRGHSAGDQLLVAVSDILRKHAPRDTVAARFGGEEFIIAGLLDDGTAALLAEHVRREVAALPDAITVSIGAATADVGDAEDHELQLILDRLVDAADDAMYSAKRAGGNRVHMSR